MIVPNLVWRTNCRFCASDNLEEILSLGEHYLYRCIPEGDNSPQYSAPLDLILCEDCCTLQLRHTVPRDLLFREYFYESGVNLTMRNALTDITAKIENLLPLQSGDIVVDIGSNDSYMLTTYKTQDIVRVGFEPAENLMEKAKRYGYAIINDYFNAQAYEETFSKKAKVITAIAMFYDLEEPLNFVKDVASILDDKGLFVMQMNYLPLMLWQNAFDNIGHEHVTYPSLTSMEPLLEKCGLKVARVEFNQVNGGSIRLYITKTHLRYPIVNGSVDAIRQMETVQRLHDVDVYLQFGRRVQAIKMELQRIILEALQEEKRIYVYGASTRGSTTLQYCGLSHKEIKAAADRNPSKWGTRTAGTNIPIISEEQMRKEKPDYLLILPWQFLNEFLKREKEYLDDGGKFIVPMPYVRVIGA